MLTRRQQQQRKQAREKEAAEIARLSKQLGRNPDGKAVRKKAKDNDLSVAYRSDVSPYKSLAGTVLDKPDTFAFEVDDFEMREKLAQVEIERKKKRIAPLYNKGGLQYITDDMDLTTLGRKV
jgi:hypothetical protein